MTTSDCFKYEFFGNNDSDLSNIFTNKGAVNSILPFGIHINGGVSTCITKCGHSLNNCDNVKIGSKDSINNVTNYGKILVIRPTSKNSELILNYDARNENANSDGSGTYKLKYICFTCPSTIKIGEIDSDLQSYLVYSNDQGLYTVVCVLYRVNQPYDNLANSLLNGLLNNNLPEKGKSINGSSLGIDSINISDFFPQNQQDYYEFVNTEKNSSAVKNNILVKVFAKKLNISSSALNNLKEKLYDSSANCRYVNFNDSLNSVFSIKPENLNIFYVPDLGISNMCGTKEKMMNLEKNVVTQEVEEEVFEEEMSVIEKLTKANLQEKKEKYINFEGDIKIYAIDIHTGAVKRIGSGENEKDQVYKNINELLVQNKNYNEDEIKRAINEFPNYIYQNAYWRLDYKVRLYKVKDQDEDDLIDTSFTIEDANNLDDAVTKIGNTNNKDVFYAMKNFPNYPINDYYVSYYYTTDSTETSYIVIMYLIFCTLIFLFNYVFYRYLFYITNVDYGEISITDDEITTDDNLKQLASWRILINIFFVLQIVSTIIFCVIKLNNLDSNIDTYSNLFIVLSGLILFFSLGYAYLRLHFKDEKVSYAESKSLILLLENDDENDNKGDVGFIKYTTNLINLIKNNLFLSEDEDFQEIYNKLSNLRNELSTSNDESLEDSTVDKLTTNADQILESLKPYLEKVNNNDKTKSIARKKLEKLGKFLSDKTFGKFENASGTGRGKLKKNAQDKIKQIKQLIQSVNNTESTPSNTNQTGGVITPPETPITPPIITGMKKSTNNSNPYETNKILNGKEYWPDGNYLENEYSNIEKSDLWENFMEVITFKNILISLLFLVLFSFLTSKVMDIIGTFDTTNKKKYKYYTLIMYSISAIIYYGSIFVPCIIKSFYLCKMYFLPEEGEKEFKAPSTSFLGKLLGGIFFILYILFVYFRFDTIENNFWLIIGTYCLILLVFGIFNRQKISNNNILMGLLFSCIGFITLYPVIFEGTTQKKVDLIIALPLVVAYIYYVLTSNQTLHTTSIDDAITFYNVDFKNNNKNEKKLEEPVTIPEINKLKEIHEAISNLSSKGGNYKKKINNLSKHKKYLLDLSEYFGSINDSKNREMVNKITSEIDALE